MFSHLNESVNEKHSVGAWKRDILVSTYNVRDMSLLSVEFRAYVQTGYRNFG